jgi:hypothetical protein
MKKVTLLSALCLIGALCALPLANTFAQAPTYKYNSAPMQPIYRGQTAVYRIHVTDNIKIADVRVALYAKTVIYSSLRIELVSPTGTTIILKDAQPGGNPPWYGPLGTADSYCLFRNGGNTMTGTTAPNDGVFKPVNSLTLLNGEFSAGWWTVKLIDEPVFAANAAQQSGMWYAYTLMFNEVIEEPELVLYEQTLVGSGLTPQINGRDVSGAVIPNYHDDLGNACSGGIFTLGKNGDCFPFVISGVPGNIGDPIPPFVSPGRFTLDVNIATNYPGGPQFGALTEDIGIYLGQAVENFAGSLPTPPAVHPAPTVASDWPTGLATTTGSLYPNAPNGINGGVKLIACPSFTNLTAGDFGGYSGVTFSDNALENIIDANPCGGIPSTSSGICGEYVPEQTLSSMAGARNVNGLYYVTIYDGYGDGAASMKDINGNLKFGQIRVLSLTLRYIAGGGETPSPNLNQAFAGPLFGVPTPGAIDGTIIGYRTSVGNTIPPYTYHGIVPTSNPSQREPILYFTNIQKMYQGNSVGYLHEELINANTGSWSTVGNHGPIAYPGALDDNSMDPNVTGNSAYADVIQIPDGMWKMRQKLVQARYDADASDNEATGPVFSVTPNTFAYYKTRVNNWDNYTNPTNEGLQIPAYLGPGTGISVAFTLFNYPTTKIVSVDYLMDMLAGTSGPTPQSDWRITIWGATNGMTGDPGGSVLARSTTIYANQYIPGTDNWRTAPIYSVDQNGAPDLNNPGVSLAPGTYFVTFDIMGRGQVALYPYTYGQAPTLDDRIMTYNFSDNFGPLGPAAALGSHLSYLTTDIDSPPNVAWSGTNAPIMANYTFPMKLNMDYKNDFAVDYVTFDGTLGNESVALPNAPFVPSFYVSSRTLQNNGQADCNIRLKIYQGTSWQPGDYIYDQVVTLNPFQTRQITCADWTPSLAGSYTVEASLSRTPNDYNEVNNAIKFDLLVSATKAIVVAGNNAGSGKVNDLQNMLESRGQDVRVVDANDASLASATNSTIYVIGDVNNANLLTGAVNNGNTIAFWNDNMVASVANSDKVFQVARTADYNENSAKLAVDIRQVDQVKQSTTKPLTINYTSKEDLLNFIGTQSVKPEDVQMITPSAKAIEAMQTDFSSLLPPVENCPFGDLRYITEKNTGIVYVVPTLHKAAPKSIDQAAGTFTLEQNYPNPFNPTTMISYSVKTDAQVTLRVLDLLGKEVATLVNDHKVAGNYSVSFNGMDNNGNVIPSGTYLYRIDVTTASGETFTNTKKMTLSK